MRRGGRRQTALLPDPELRLAALYGASHKGSAFLSLADDMPVWLRRTWIYRKAKTFSKIERLATGAQIYMDATKRG